MKIFALIFLVIYQYLTAPIEMQLPPAPVAEQKDIRPTLSIKVAQDGSISHGDKKITVKQLTDLCRTHKKKHENGRLSIQAHKQSKMNDVRIVLDTAAKADLEIVVLATK